MITSKIAGTLRTWYSDVGDFVEPDEIVAEMETASGSKVAIAAPAAGRIAEIHVLAGDTVVAGTVLAQIDEAPLLYDLLDGGQKPKRKQPSKPAAMPSRRQFLFILSLLIMFVLGGGAALLLFIVPAPFPAVSPASFVTPRKPF